jgi:hypothetical protein
MLPELPSVVQFEAWLREWQPLLSLQAWKIKVSLVPAKKLSDPKHTAEVWANHEARSAEVLISRDEEASEYLDPESHDWEETLVHELVHLTLDGALPGEPLERWRDILYEQGIHALAGALVRVKRQQISGAAPDDGTASRNG